MSSQGQEPSGHFRVERGRAAEFRKVSPVRFRGWHVLGAAGTQAAIIQTFNTYGWSVFVRYFMQDYGWTATMMGAVVSFNRINNLYRGPISGWIGDTFGPRLCAGIGVPFLAVNFAIYGLSTEYWHILVAYGVVMGMGSACWSRAYGIAIVRWWVDRRAFAQGLFWIASGLSGTVFLAPLAFAMEQYGWRWGAWLGVIGIGLMWPLCLGYPSAFPEQYGQYVDNTSPEEKRARAEASAARRGTTVRARPALVDLTLRQALVDRAFWLTALAAAIQAAGAAPLTIFQNQRMGTLGYSVTTAALFYSWRNWMSMAGRFLVMVVGDWLGAKYPVRYTLAAIRFVEGLGQLLFAYGRSDIWFYGWGILNGIPYGLGLTWGTYFIAEYFGRAAFGTVIGIRTALTAIMGFIAPTLLGWVADTYGWEWTFTWVFICYAGAGLMYAFTPPPKLQARERAKEETS